VLRAVLLALVVLLTACSPTPITPPPGDPADPTTSTRPRDIDISGLLPCDLLTPAQRLELGLDGEPRLNSGGDALFGEARTCDIRQFAPSPSVRLSVTLGTEFGIERFSQPDLVSEITATEVGGYPAVLSPPPPSMPTSCLIAVDSGPGQMVGVMLSDGGSDPGVPADELCRRVPRYAGAVMETLRSR
jgi:hypothetical protein